MQAQIHMDIIEYKDGEANLEGYLAYDESISGIRPGVIIVHAWKGLDDYVKKRATDLAELGYIAFAADIYGKGIRPGTPQEAMEQAAKYRKDRPLMRSRVNTALRQIRSFERVDKTRIAAMGYCFGGGVALELARSGADLSGVVSFHGNLDTPNPGDAKNIKAKILVLHGSLDPHVNWEQVGAFRHEMEKAEVNWQMNIYSGAVHAFTMPSAGNDPSKGSAYNEQADRRSWIDMRMFFDEIFR